MKTPKERCGLKAKHNPHEWFKANVFRRWCPGLSALAANAVQRKEPKNG